MMIETEKITCCHCGAIQNETLYDLVDVDVHDGEFPHKCDICEEYFNVVFEFAPFIQTEYI